MNGIIHPCARPEGRPPPATPEEMYAAIFQYIDRVFSVVRPRRLLFMAIDGPAPRAKMNQQRTRRFKAAKERADKAAEAAALRSELKAAGRVPPEPSDKVAFDSNVITPGTAFMANLAKWLRYYVQLRLHSDPAWANIQVIAPASLTHLPSMDAQRFSTRHAAGTLGESPCASLWAQ